MQRWALLLEYDGAPFLGWQTQADGPSVQSALEAAVSRLTGTPTPCTAAGRTDSGVHAAGQVVHADITRPIAAERLVAALNFHLKPQPVAVVRAAAVGEGFNARFSAVGRAYCYTILNRPARPALLAGRVWHVPRPLDAARMHAAAQSLLGKHDFTSFRAASCQANSALRTLDRLDVTRAGDRIVIVAEARSFLHHQVRNMAGTLMKIGDGSWPVTRMAEILAARDRSAAGQTAPPEGLCLTHVSYETDPFAGGDA